MPTAYIHLPAHVGERRVSFINGFARLGFIVQQSAPPEQMRKGDAVVIWNHTARSNQSVERAQQDEAAVIVAENGYFGTDATGWKKYALALDGHNGSGRWYVGDRSRLEAANLSFKPLRPIPHEGRVLIAAQRGIGSAIMRSPHNFENHINADIQARRPGRFDVRIRPHPGRHTPPSTLLDDLSQSDALVVWSSNCATAALIEGVPTFYYAPTIVSAGAAVPYKSGFPDMATDEAAREAAFHRMSWAQWTLAEIDSGEAFKTLLAVQSGTLPSCQPGLGG